MYAIVDEANTIIGFEDRKIPLKDLVHSGYSKNYIETDDVTLKLGDIYHRDTKTFEKIEIIEDVPTIEIPVVTATQNDRIEANTDFIMMMMGV